SELEQRERIAHERRVPGQSAKNDGCQSIHVDPPVEALRISGPTLRRKIGGRAGYGAVFGHTAQMGELGETEVEQAHAAIVEDVDIRGLYIAVQNVVSVRRSEERRVGKECKW